MKRRELFSSLVSSFKKDEKQEKIIRPPYYKNEDIFFTNCKNCDGLCATVCEENIVIIQEDFTPKLNFVFFLIFYQRLIKMGVYRQASKKL